MNYCSSCGNKLDKNAIFCSSCGEEIVAAEADLFEDKPRVNTVKKESNDFITILCILTLVGSALGVFRGLFYQAVAHDFGGNLGYHRGWMFAVANLGTIAGAIIMMNKSKVGLVLYTVFQVAYLALVVFTSFIYVEEDLAAFSMLISMFFLIPSIAFLIMYWLPQNRDALH